MVVFLIHGMGRSRLSMVPLAAHLRAQGYATSLFGYSVATRSFDTIAEGFLKHLRDAGAGGDSPYAIVGHSLGNIITRYLSARLPERLERFVMLAPPNRPPALARAGRKRLPYRLLTGDAGQRLGDPDFYASLGRPDAPTLIIAGNRSSPLLAYRGAAPNDGIVSVDETRLPGVALRVVPAIHTLIMNHPEARALLRRFLAEGSAASLGREPL